MKIKFTILGCGSSLGIPRIDGYFGKCNPREPKNFRTRCCALVTSGKKNILIENKFTNKFEKKFDTIIYMSVLEHIEHDVSEINIALSKLESQGYLIILVPAHNYMYSQFDKEIGHFKRYEIDFFQNLKFNNSKIIKCFMTDTMGWILYYLNKIFYKNEKYPSKLKIFLWDKIFTPITSIADFLLMYKFEQLKPKLEFN